MKIIEKLKAKLHTLQSYHRSIKLFLLVPILFGLYFAIKGLFFNFYILSLGYDKGFLGLANGMTPAATLVLAFPLGVLTDRIGRKRAVFTAMVILAASYLAFLMVTDRTLILVTLFVSGIGEALYFVAATPLLTRLTDQSNRVTVFSLRAAFFSFSGVIGSYIGGQLPLWFDRLLGIPPGTYGSYRGILLTSFGLLLLTLIPVLMIPRGDGEVQRARKLEPDQPGWQVLKDIKSLLEKKVVWQLFFPNLAIGLGAALMVPYLNIFLVETFNITDQTLGTLFSISALITATGTLLSPWMARQLGTRIRALVVTQASSLVFLLVLGFSPWLAVAVIGFWGRNVLMNMAQPLFNTFSMEQVSDNEQGTLNSMLSLSWNIGWAIMPVVSGVVQEHYGFTPIFVTTGLLYALSTVLIWVFFKDSEKPTQPMMAAITN